MFQFSHWLLCKRNNFVILSKQFRDVQVILGRMTHTTPIYIYYSCYLALNLNTLTYWP